METKPKLSEYIKKWADDRRVQMSQLNNLFDQHQQIAAIKDCVEDVSKIFQLLKEIAERIEST